MKFAVPDVCTQHGKMFGTELVSHADRQTDRQ